MHVTDVDSEEENEDVMDNNMTKDDVLKLFNTMTQESGLKNTYQVFKSNTFRESLHIPQLIWNELEPAIKEKILEAKEKAKAKQANKVKPPSKIPDQYPTKKTQNSTINLCSSLADLGIEDDESSTDDEALTSNVFMVSSAKIDPIGSYSGENEADQPIQV